MKTLILTIFAILAIPFAAPFAQAQDNALPQLEPMSKNLPPVYTMKSLSPAKKPEEEMAMPTLGIKPGEAEPLRETVTDRSVTTIDDLRLRLNMGHVVELVGIEIPENPGYDPGETALRAKKFLDTLFDGKGNGEVVLYQTRGSGKGRVNRMGHDLAHVVRKNGNVWVQGALIANGFARAYPTPSNPELADKMYALEDEARKAEKGLWAKDSPYRMINANEPTSSDARFAVVEGVVQKASIVNNVVYLNFDSEWKNDFTVGIPSTIRQAMSRKGVDVLKMQGQHVRARGWIRYYNGPYIELEDPTLLQQVENDPASKP